MLEGLGWKTIYPGCAVDTPNHFYSYSFNPNDKWSRHFSRRDEILDYIGGHHREIPVCDNISASGRRSRQRNSTNGKRAGM